MITDGRLLVFLKLPVVVQFVQAESKDQREHYDYTVN